MQYNQAVKYILDKCKDLNLKLAEKEKIFEKVEPKEKAACY